MSNRPYIKNFDNKGLFDPCSLYNWRLEWLENKVADHHKNRRVKNESQYQAWWEDEEKVYQNNKRDMESVSKMWKDTAIIVPSHSGQIVWLRACLESCKKTGLFTLLMYDNPIHTSKMDIERRFPPADTLRLADLFLMKHKTWASGVGIPHAWNMWYGLNMLSSIGFEYVFNINGDCIMEKPEGLTEIRKMLGDKDIITCEWIPQKKYCGTMSFLGKLDKIKEIWEEYLEHLYHFNIGNAEARMGKWLMKNGATVAEVENPEDAHFKPPGTKGTWRKVLGLRHLHAEHKVRRWNQLEPIEEKYFDWGPNDIFMSGHEKNTLVKYWRTKEIKYLHAWWKS